jgi:hypothetical protein
MFRWSVVSTYIRYGIIKNKKVTKRIDELIVFDYFGCFIIKLGNRRNFQLS